MVAAEVAGAHELIFGFDFGEAFLEGGAFALVGDFDAGGVCGRCWTGIHFGDCKGEVELDRGEKRDIERERVCVVDLVRLSLQLECQWVDEWVPIEM